MKRPEEVLDDLISKIFNYILCKLIKPDMEVNSVCDLTEEKIDELINYYGIKGIILDVDETIRFDGNDIPEENEEWLDMILSKLKVVVLSNGSSKTMEEKFHEKGIEYMTLAFKPLKRGFLKSCSLLHLKPEEVAVIGDDLFDDIYGGSRNNMTTIKVSSGKQLTKRHN